MKVYEAPEIKITALLLSDILTNSQGGGNGNPGDDNFLPIG